MTPLLGSGRMATLLARLLWSRVGPPAASAEVVAGRAAGARRRRPRSPR